MSTPDPFAALGLPARPDLTDEEVQTAWRAIAAATHPDREDGGDLARFTQASAAYAALQTPWARSEAYADLMDDQPGTMPIRAIPASDADTAQNIRRDWRDELALVALLHVPARLVRGHPLRLAIRAAIAAGLSLAVLTLISGQLAAWFCIPALAAWFVFTGRTDLAPPPRR